MKLRTLMSAFAAVAVSATIAAAGLYNFPFATSTATSRSAATLPMTGSECIPGDTNLSGGRAPQEACYTQGNLKGNYVTTITSAASGTLSWSVADNAQLYQVTLGGTTTISNPTGLTTGQKFSLFVIQDSTGSRTATWGSNFQWAGPSGSGTAPTLTTTASRGDIFDFVYDGTKIQGFGANSQNRAP